MELVVYCPLESCYYEVLNVLWGVGLDTSDSEGSIARNGYNIAMSVDDVVAGVAVVAEPCKADSDRTDSQSLIQRVGVLATVYGLVRMHLDIGPDMGCCRLHFQVSSSPEHSETEKHAVADTHAQVSM